MDPKTIKISGCSGVVKTCRIVGDWPTRNYVFSGEPLISIFSVGTEISYFNYRPPTSASFVP